LRSDDAYIMDSYAWLLFKKGQAKEAMKLLEKAYGLKNREAIIAEHLADIYIALHLKQKALAMYKKALDLLAENDAKIRLAGKIENVQNALAEYSPGAGKNRSPAAFNP
jgi:tetratricopeptide (TPR) repeat protein